jgi:soluble lytic murein transglycosylase-like protein
MSRRLRGLCNFCPLRQILAPFSVASAVESITGISTAMKLFRLALPAAALAAALSVHVAIAEENPVREFLNQEFSATAPADEPAPASNQVASLTPAEPQANDKKNQNPWAGLSPALAPEKQKITPRAAATDAEKAPILALIEKHAAANAIPAAFARAVVRIESNFNPKATGSQREVGLMQIKYQTARGIGFTGTREELYDPDTNLKWGMKYLAMAWKLGGATPCGAVLRYQAGHMATQPTAASRAYCTKVQAHMGAN